MGYDLGADVPTSHLLRVILNSVLNVKVLACAFSQEKALVLGSFSMIVKSSYKLRELSFEAQV